MARPTLRLSADAASIARAAEILRTGGLVAFPTETVYGLGARADDDAAVLRIFEAKGRSAHNPLIVHVADATAARALTEGWDERADRLAARFWPGPLTLVLPRAAGTISDRVAAGGPTVGVRVPDTPVALALLEACGLPIAAPSANRSLAVSPTTADHVLADLDGRIDAVVDGGPCRVGIESTVLDLVGPATVLRPGGVSLGALREVLGDVAERGGAETVGARSPGRAERHYAPAIPLEVQPSERVDARAAELRAEGLRVAVLRSGADAAGAARDLYATLRRMEREADVIVAEAPPAGDEWAALRDRLSRGARR